MSESQQGEGQARHSGQGPGGLRLGARKSDVSGLSEAAELSSAAQCGRAWPEQPKARTTSKIQMKWRRIQSREEGGQEARERVRGTTGQVKGAQQICEAERKHTSQKARANSKTQLGRAAR